MFFLSSPIGELPTHIELNKKQKSSVILSKLNVDVVCGLYVTSSIPSNNVSPDFVHSTTPTT